MGLSRIKKVFLVTIALILALFSFYLFNPRTDKTSDKNLDRQVIVVSDKEREIFYKYFDIYQSLPVGKIGDPTKHDKVITLTSEEFHISKEETEQIFQAVSKEKPTDKEIEIYKSYDNKLNEAIDRASSAESINEEAIKNEIAEQYDIPVYKLRAIYAYVLSYIENQK